MSDTKKWQQSDANHYLHPFTAFKDLNEKKARIITKAEGAYIYDSDGNKVLDGMSGLWCCNLGYSRKDIKSAIDKQLSELPYYNSFFQCAHPSSIELAELLASVAPAHMNHVFYTNSGSEANDTSLRCIARYWQLKNQPKKKKIISRINGYHGSTIASASLGGMGFMHEQFDLLPNIVHIQQPYWFANPDDLSKEDLAKQSAKALEDKIIELGAENVAAFVGEPIQGAGGVIIPEKIYWTMIQKICDKYDILLVADEVISGFGRTGEWFASTYYNIKPDIIPFAKGVTNGYQPLGGIMLSDRLTKVLKSDKDDFAHGFTYSGHPVACAAAIATITALKNEKIIDTIKNETGPYLQQRWAELGEHRIVGEARGLCFFGALELVKDKATNTRFDKQANAGGVCRDNSIKSGLVMRATGDTMIIAPPFILSKAQIDELIDKAKLALDKTAQQLGV